MQGLYLYTLIIDLNSCNMLSILNKLPFQEELQNVTILTNVFLDKKLNHINNKTKIKHKNPCRCLEFNPEPLAPKADALPLHH